MDEQCLGMDLSITCKHAREAQRAYTISARCLGAIQSPQWLPHFRLPKIASGCSCNVNLSSENYNFTPGIFFLDSLLANQQTTCWFYFWKLASLNSSYFKILLKKVNSLKKFMKFTKFVFGLANFCYDLMKIDIHLNGF